MRPRLRHLLLAWTAIVAQAAVTLLGPAGLLLCREANGSSHLEWLAQHCCARASEATPVPHESAEIAGADEACINCVDEVLGPAPAVTPRVVQANETDHCACPAITFAALAPPDSSPALGLRRFAGLATAATGPPRQVCQVLATTVLNL